eukprot:TRINITY_DN2580_c0_g1_i4.p1 TRINITY_DN2580_c0_g1~~TRINITY_DN2580_c0_g1_i4.p1  ORF type:complete len:930 (-),score=290.19 TRINITY_DN2580_c0_g1_i4:2-2746(-)
MQEFTSGGESDVGYQSLMAEQHHSGPLGGIFNRSTQNASKAQPGDGKLSTFMGVYVPCMLSIFGVILFERLGWQVGQAGVFETVLMFLLGYTLITLTTLSISAISTNGKMKGGGAYYMISRALGPEFGGSIGLIFYFANIAAGALYMVGFTDALAHTFGSILPETRWFKFLYASIVLAILTLICLVGAEAFAKTSIVIFTVLIVAVFFAAGSLCFATPDPSIGFTGFSPDTFSGNLDAHYSVDEESGRMMNFQAVFSIFFPATTGIMAGANMSGDLANPGKSIPQGTLLAIATTFVVYIFLVFILGSTVSNYTLRTNYFIMQSVSVPWIIAAGIFCATLSSALSAIIGSSRILQALARDDLLPILAPFKKGSGKSDEPRRAVLCSWALIQLALLIGKLNIVAPITTMFFLISYFATNFACFAMTITGAPNFRPHFKYFHWGTSLVGAIGVLFVMFYVEAVYAALACVVMVLLFIYIHYRAPPASWGDISQALIYHQVRKYLLRLDVRKDHVKYWRPQILLMVSNPRSSYNLIDFSNNMKKGGLFVLGHVLCGSLEENHESLHEQQRAYLDLVSLSQFKAFTEIVIAPSVRNGAQNLMLTCGLGGMKPNTVVIGFYDQREQTAHKPHSLMLRKKKLESSVQSVLDEFPPLRDSSEPSIIQGLKEFYGIIKDAQHLEKHVLLARHFEKLDKTAVAETLTQSQVNLFGDKSNQMMTIDIWPISANGWASSDTVSLSLLMGFIVSMTDVWLAHTRIRVLNFVETKEEVPLEQENLQELLDDLRIEAEVKVFSIEGTYLRTYDRLVVQRESAAAKAMDEQESSSPSSSSSTTSSESSSRRSKAPLSFKTLTSNERVQVLNELFVKESERTAVAFFTLPAFFASDDERLAEYHEDLTILTNNLPPTILVQASSTVVTTEI